MRGRAMIDLPGVPEGYRALRWGVVGKDQWLVQADGSAVQWPGDTPSEGQHLIVEPVNPKTRTVVFHEVAYGDDENDLWLGWCCNINDAREAWTISHPTGHTREVEIPCDE